MNSMKYLALFVISSQSMPRFGLGQLETDLGWCLTLSISMWAIIQVAVFSVKMNGEEETWKELDAEFDRCIVDVKPHILKLQHRSGKYGNARVWRNTNNSILPYC